MPDMPPLPKARVARSMPFANTGLDYLGPLYVKHSNDKRKKRWVCLFTSLDTRAIHSEVVNDMTCAEFLYAFRRFIETTGTPVKIISDNASQFKLGSSTIDLAWKKTIINIELNCFHARSSRACILYKCAMLIFKMFKCDFCDKDYKYL